MTRARASDATSRGRRATPEELRLWVEVARTVAPLGGRTPIEPEPALAGHRPPPAPLAARSAPNVSGKPPSLPPLAGIDRRTVVRLTRGTIRIDARLDLHGMTQQAAHGRLVRFMRQAQAADGTRLVLIITGKGKPGAEAPFDAGRGVLRRAVPMWLSAAEMRPYVVGFGEAAPHHGGSGALYVRIRRKRST